MQNNEFVFLKLGGSLITNKNRPHTSRRKVLADLAQEIYRAKCDHPDMRLLIGHGSGSFGHIPAKKHHTREGVYSPDQWSGFVEVWRQARTLNEIVIEALQTAHLPVMAFPPSALVYAADGKVSSWDLSPLQAALKVGLVPVINGDVIFDSVRSGTILSTEELFSYLQPILHPTHILLAGLEKGVWSDFPCRTKIISEITPLNYDQILSSLKNSAAIDVTGGMLGKVSSMLKLVEADPQLNVLIFSGLESDLLYRSLCNEKPGTYIHNQLQGGNP